MEDLRKSTPIIMIDNSNGSLVYVIGVCHVSEDSRRAVKNLIRNVQPDLVILELCEGRKALLYEDEGTLREGLAKEEFGWFGFTFDAVANMKKLYVILGTKFGILPGGEMKTAYDEAKKIPGTKVLLGDLPMELTEQKMEQGFSFWDKLRFAFLILILSFLSIFMTAEQMMNLVMANSNDSEDEKGGLLLDGRDEFLTFSLQRAAETWIFDEDEECWGPPTVVGVVGLAHIPGIVRNWGLITEEDINQLLESYKCDMENFDINKEREV